MGIVSSLGRDSWRRRGRLHTIAASSTGPPAWTRPPPDDQGAYLLSGAPVAGGELFYSLAPAPLVLPLVVRATLATIVASQALISGAFSLTSQAIGLGLFPRIDVRHTHSSHAGQIYVPFVNWAL